MLGYVKTYPSFTELFVDPIISYSLTPAVPVATCEAFPFPLHLLSTQYWEVPNMEIYSSSHRLFPYLTPFDGFCAPLIPNQESQVLRVEVTLGKV